MSILHSLVRQGSPQSLQLYREIEGAKLHVLIDNGSTYNFVQSKLVEIMQLQTKSICVFKVYIGNGDSLECSYMCLKVMVTMQGTEFVLDFYVLLILINRVWGKIFNECEVEF